MKALFCFVASVIGSPPHTMDQAFGDYIHTLEGGDLTVSEIKRARDSIRTEAAGSFDVRPSSVQILFTSVTKLDE